MPRADAEMAKALTLTKAKKETLHNTIISQQGPGTIMADFQTFLEFIADRHAPLSAKHYMPIKVLESLNQQMCQPLQHDLRRALQKSYPYLNGLYLLVRSSGLAYVDNSGKKPALMLNEPIYNSWQTLNPTERYFTLLETWLLHASAEIIGERSGVFFGHPWFGLYPLVANIPDEGLDAASGENLLHSFTYSPGVYNVALMASFGLLSIQSGQPFQGEGWKIDSVRRTPWGEALLAVTVRQAANSNLIKFDQYDDAPYGALQPLLQPYFPEWQNNLSLPQHEFQEGLFIFKAALRKSIWRRIAIPANGTLEGLSRAILKAFSFNNDHLHQFIYTNQSGAQERAYHNYMDERPWTHEVSIGDLPIQEGASMIYHFDFGDDWRFEVTLEKIDVENETIKEPTLLEQHGKAPEQYPNHDD